MSLPYHYLVFNISLRGLVQMPAYTHTERERVSVSGVLIRGVLITSVLITGVLITGGLLEVC